jgi:hypothetical protein
LDVENIIDSNIRDEFRCLICVKLVNNPNHCLNCEEIFCQKCLEDYLKYNYDKCPHCQKMRFLTKKSIKLMKIINSSNIKCPNCPEVIRYEQFNDHSSKCKFYICKKCNIQLPVQNENELVNHLNECFDICKYCKKKLPLSILKSHETSCNLLINFILRCYLDYFDNINEQKYANLAFSTREILNELEL